MIGEVLTVLNFEVSTLTAFVMFGIAVAFITGMIAYFIHKHIITELNYTHKQELGDAFYRGKMDGVKEAQAFSRRPILARG